MIRSYLHITFMTLKIHLKRRLSCYVLMIGDSLNLKWGFKAFDKVAVQ